MPSVPVQISLALAGPFFLQITASPSAEKLVDSSFFEGRWAFAEDGCDEPSNWTMISGGNFVSDDLVGTWQWREGKLILNLVDLAVDEETGEAGGKFQMDGPIEIIDSNRFKMKIEPDVYSMKRCSN